MNIQMRDPKSLTMYHNNPKDHPEEQIEALAKTITDFGFDQPVVVDKNDVIIKGHGRTLAAIKLGLALIPVVVSEAGAQADQLNRILDNHLTSRDYDQYNLREDLVTLEAKGALGMSLYNIKDIPPQVNFTPKTEATLFSLVTYHKCPSCNYRW